MPSATDPSAPGNGSRGGRSRGQTGLSLGLSEQRGQRPIDRPYLYIYRSATANNTNQSCMQCRLDRQGEASS
uniref:Uncharacterized protein n=1 Tax=Oryza glumipatula TaxID=40148 RepID=A0A0D9YZI1_9ORYZ